MMKGMKYNCSVSQCSTPRSVNTPKKGFRATNDKAVFLTGLRKLSGEEYDDYRTTCYNDLQKYGSGSRKIYVKKFDYPKNANCAYLHVKTRGMADLLKSIKNLTLAGDSVKVYEYAPSEKRQDEERVAPKQLLEPTYDSGVNSTVPTGYHTPANYANSDVEKETSLITNDWATEVDTEMVAPVVTRQASTLDTAPTAEIDNLQNKLMEISATQMISIMESINIPEAVSLYFPTESAKLKATACAGVMQGIYTESEYNTRIAAIYNTIVLPTGVNKFMPELHNQLMAQAFTGIMSGAFSVAEFNEKFAAMFFQKVQSIYNQENQISALASISAMASLSIA